MVHIAETSIDLGVFNDVWRIALFVAAALVIGAFTSDAIGGGGLKSTRWARLALIVLLLARIGAMAERFGQPLTLWNAPFTTVALTLMFVSWRAYGDSGEEQIRATSGVAPRLPRVHR